MENLKIVPFGKYKGQPIEAMQNDKSYLDWLSGQDWFRSRYPQLNTIIINNFNEPSDTPEHNALVALFTDDEFILKFLKYISNGIICKGRFITKTEVENAIIGYFKENRKYSYNDFTEAIEESIRSQLSNGYTYRHLSNDVNYNVSFEDKKGSDVNLSYSYAQLANVDFKKMIVPDELTLDEEYLTLCTAIKGLSICTDFENSFIDLLNDKGYNKLLGLPIQHYFEWKVKKILNINPLFVYHRVRNKWKNGPIRIECKPIISDDYPTIMRQCRNQGSSCLLTYKYTGTGATLDQVKKMFPDIKILMVQDILSTQLHELKSLTP